MKRALPIASDALPSGGAAHFEALVEGALRPCVAVRSPAGLFGWVNVCAHRNQPVVVDDRPLDDVGRLECRAHGAVYDLATGLCVEGPCVGRSLRPVAVGEEDGRLWVEDDDTVDDSAYADEAQ